MNGRILYIFAIPAAIALVLCIIVGVLTWWPIALLSVPLALFVVWLMYRRSDEVVFNSINARGLGQTEGERVRNLVENLCLSTGIDHPEIKVIDSSACNVAVIGAHQKTLVFTSGLLEQLDLLEMEGVVAHALSRVSDEDTKYPTAALSARPLVTSRQMRTAFGWSSTPDSPVAYDIAGVGLTRYPPGLKAALICIHGKDTTVEGAGALGSAWFVPPETDPHQLDHRIEVLEELS